MPQPRDRRYRGRAAALSLMLLLGGCARTERAVAPAATPTAEPVWHYEGAEGPDHWGSLSPKFAACGTGLAQSPIDIANPVADTHSGGAPQFAPATLQIAHQPHADDGVNNGHTIQINYQGGDTLMIGAERYVLAQYHFHHQSEHTIKGAHFPMEMHLVHRSAAGQLAVIGVFIEAGAHNAAFDPIWTDLPKAAGTEKHYEHVQVDGDAFLPVNRAAYRYDGSLTTPPCTEGVKWIVMTTPIQLSAEQIGRFTALIPDNYRTVQPLNGRPVAADEIAP